MAKMQSNEQGFGHAAEDEPKAGSSAPDSVVPPADDTVDDLLEADVSQDGDIDILNAQVDNAAAPAQSANEEDETAPPAAEKLPPRVDNQTYNKQEKTDKPYWYVVYTYSGYEKRVKANLEKTIQNHGLQDTIIDVQVPEAETIETKNGKRKHVTRKLYPGYVMVKMFLTDESWYVVRNTRGVTGFVGPASKPIPLSEREVRAMGIDEGVRITLDVQIGDEVMITGGPFESFTGRVQAVDTEKQIVTVIVPMFGRDVPMDTDFVLVKKI